MSNDPYVLAVRWLGLRSLSEEEIRGRLRDKGFTRDIIDLTIDKLNRFGFLGDRALAERIVTLGLAGRRLGPSGIRQKLYQRRIHKDVAEAVWQELTADVNWGAIAQELMAQYDINDPRAYGRFIRYLSRQGFPPSVIANVVENVHPSKETQQKEWQ